MFYYLIAPYLTYNAILIAAAVIPAIILLIYVYRSDKLEKEAPLLLGKLVVAGIISTQIALLLERISSEILYNLVDPYTELYRVLLYFVCVGVSEEGAKYFMLKRNTWRSPEYNCLFDGIVYATFISLGFALWENISYVMHYGFTNALVRAFTAIPGHACFGVFMGVFYSASKMYDYLGDKKKSSMYEVFAVVVPVLIHGLYDYIATYEGYDVSLYFIAFIVVLFIVSIKIIKNISKNDRYIDFYGDEYYNPIINNERVNDDEDMMP